MADDRAKPPAPLADLDGRIIAHLPITIWQPQDWKTDAACKGMDTNLFHPGRGDSTSTLAAKAICARCPVAEQCAEYAWRNGETVGIWGGMSERQRRALRTKLGRQLRPIQHGSVNGRRIHLKRGEEPCDLCNTAWRTYNAHRQAAAKQKARAAS